LFLGLKSKERKWQIDCGLEGEIARVKVLLDPTEREREMAKRSCVYLSSLRLLEQIERERKQYAT